MENTQEVYRVVSTFTKIPIAEINDSTPIDRKSVGSSIHLHRMYAALSKIGVDVTSIRDIITVGDLLKICIPSKYDEPQRKIHLKKEDSFFQLNEVTQNPSVGIDIEQIGEFPVVNDYRLETFYINNFTQSEIAYAILQSNPIATFAGLFAAKEAIVKCQQTYRTTPFNEIEIKHDDHGKPIFTGMSISISHVDFFAVAVAIAQSTQMFTENSPKLQGSLPPFRITLQVLILISVLTSIIALILSIYSR